MINKSDNTCKSVITKSEFPLCQIIIKDNQLICQNAFEEIRSFNVKDIKRKRFWNQGKVLVAKKDTWNSYGFCRMAIFGNEDYVVNNDKMESIDVINVEDLKYPNTVKSRYYTSLFYIKSRFYASRFSIKSRNYAKKHNDKIQNLLNKVSQICFLSRFYVSSAEDQQFRKIEI